MNCLLKVLDLLADFFQLRLAGDDVLRNCGVVRLRAERIQFAENFLSNEFEGAADRFVLAQMMRELREMTFEPGQFLRNVGAVGEKRDFLEQALVVGRKIESGLVDSLEQSRRDISSPRPDEAREPP